MNEKFRYLLLCSCFLGVMPSAEATVVQENGMAVDIQQKKVTVKGKITDTKGEPIIGATVRVQSTTNAVISDVDGAFTINAPVNSILEVSYIGFPTKKIKVANKGIITVVLQAIVR